MNSKDLAFTKVCRTILSCKTNQQLRTSGRLIDNYNQLYAPSKFMLQLYSQKYESLAAFDSEMLENSLINLEHHYN
jgi:hypothetical protein